MKSLCIIITLWLIAATGVVAQELKIYGNIELRNGVFYYHEVALDKLVVWRSVAAQFEIASKDCESISYYQNDNMKIMVIAKKNSTTYEIPVGSVSSIVYSGSMRGIELHVF
jgi:effector-binding domain-containing protein